MYHQIYTVNILIWYEDILKKSIVRNGKSVGIMNDLFTKTGSHLGFEALDDE